MQERGLREASFRRASLKTPWLDSAAAGCFCRDFISTGGLHRCKLQGLGNKAKWKLQSTAGIDLLQDSTLGLFAINKKKYLLNAYISQAVAISLRAQTEPHQRPPCWNLLTQPLFQSSAYCSSVSAILYEIAVSGKIKKRMIHTPGEGIGYSSHLSGWQL